LTKQSQIVEAFAQDFCVSGARSALTRATRLSLCLLVFLCGCEQFVHGYIVHVDNETGQELTVLTKIPDFGNQSCKMQPGDNYLMTISSELEVTHGDTVWVYNASNLEQERAVLLVRCARSGIFTPSVSTWQIKSDGRIYYLPPTGAPASGTASEQPPGFPLVPATAKPIKTGAEELPH
jgi:hypothetical protein